ncbi:MAG: AAA domain-containing protein [Mollicutes bacterium]|nr:MAG: AAA domain-containing protein [Mollicutes bacterium]
MDHDSSQFAAIYEALNGKNLLIQGPPGTGKSQTIANIISVLIRDNKKVLFVAQKQAALDVVRNKLKAVGLSEYILEVFSTKANKRAIIESIKSSLIFTPPANNITLLREQHSKQDLREYLNEYVDLMGEKFGKTNKTINDIL